MVKIAIGKGRTANQIIQYMFARIIAEELDYELDTSGLNCIQEFISKLPPHKGKNKYVYKENTDIQQKLNHTHDLKDPLLIHTIISDKTPREIILKGWWQRWRHYKHYVDKIKTWLQDPYQIPNNTQPNDVAVHIRKGDIMTRAGKKDSLPDEWYINMLERFGPWDNIWLSCDGSYGKYITIDNEQVNIDTKFPKETTKNGIDHPLVKKIQNKFDNVHFIKEDDPVRVLYTLSKFNNLILSQGTFSWMAGFLSNARRIFRPIPLWDQHPQHGLAVNTLKWHDSQIPYLDNSRNEIPIDMLIDDNPCWINIVVPQLYYSKGVTWPIEAKLHKFLDTLEEPMKTKYKDMLTLTRGECT